MGGELREGHQAVSRPDYAPRQSERSHKVAQQGERELVVLKSFTIRYVASHIFFRNESATRCSSESTDKFKIAACTA